MLMFAHDFAQAATDAVTRNCAADWARCDKSRAKRNGFFCFQNAEQY
jgi:hypothetical protein